MRRLLLFSFLLSASLLMAQSDDLSQSNRPPRSDSESSSKDAVIDLRPPMGDAKAHPNSDVSNVLELHPYNPMKAMKAIEVGDFYYKEKNYKAAISRYREALEYKPNDAVATLHLANAYEKAGEADAARDMYDNYLKTLPNGPGAPEAKAALKRLAKSSK